MSADSCLAHIPHPDWLADGPLTGLVTPFIEALRAQRYAERTIFAYVSSLAHFSFWLKSKGLEESSISPAIVERFLRHHLPACRWPAPCRSAGSDIPAALRHLLNGFPRRSYRRPPRSRSRLSLSALVRTFRAASGTSSCSLSQTGYPFGDCTPPSGFTNVDDVTQDHAHLRA